jgi:small multidrug resistance family-3 protein
MVASLIWGWVIEGARPDRWDILGATVAIAGAAIILFGPRSSQI